MFFNLHNNHYKVCDTFPYMPRIVRRYGIYFENANAYFNESTVLLTLEKLSGPPLCVSRSVPHYLRESWKSPPQYCASELLLGQANCDYITREVSKMASYDLTAADLAPIPLPEAAVLKPGRCWACEIPSIRTWTSSMRTCSSRAKHPAIEPLKIMSGKFDRLMFSLVQRIRSD